MRGVCWLVMLALLPEVYFCLYMLTRCQFEQRTLYLGGAIMFGALFVMLVRRLVVLGVAWLEYDDEKVVFHLNRSEEEVVPWAELPSDTVRLKVEGRNLIFCFLPTSPEEREVQMLVAPTFSGYRDFRQECERRGVIRKPPTAKEIFEAMSPYLEEMLDYAEQKKDEQK